MNAGAFGENFPYSNFHDLNTDWIIKIAKDFLDQYTHIQQIIEEGETTLQNTTTEGLQQLQEKATNLETLLQAWYDEHSEDIANQLAKALNDLNEWYAQHSSDIQNELTTALSSAITNFNESANQKLAETLKDIPSGYTELANEVTTIKRRLDGNIHFTNGISSVLDEKQKLSIASSKRWSSPDTSFHIIIPVVPGDVVYTKANSSRPTIIAGLKSYNPINDGLVDFSEQTGWTDRIIYDANSTHTDTIPSDVNYLYVLVIANTTNVHTPSILTINDIDVTYNIRDKIANINTRTSATENAEEANKELHNVLSSEAFRNLVVIDKPIYNVKYIKTLTLNINPNTVNLAISCSADDNKEYILVENSNIIISVNASMSNNDYIESIQARVYEYDDTKTSLGITHNISTITERNEISLNNQCKYISVEFYTVIAPHTMKLTLQFAMSSIIYYNPIETLNNEPVEDSRSLDNMLPYLSYVIAGIGTNGDIIESTTNAITNLIRISDMGHYNIKCGTDYDIKRHMYNANMEYITAYAWETPNPVPTVIQGFDGYIRIEMKKKNGGDMTTTEADDIIIEFTENMANNNKNALHLTVATHNIGAFYDGTTFGYPDGSLSYDQILEIASKWKRFNQALNADIIGIQEFCPFVNANRTVNSRQTVFNPVYEKLHSALGGLATGTRFETLSTKYGNFSTGRPYSIHYLKIKGITLAFYNVHLTFDTVVGSGNRNDQREVERSELIEMLKNEEYFIATGDYNAANIEEYQVFKDNGFRIANGGNYGTFNTAVALNDQTPTCPMDNIVVSNNIIITRALRPSYDASGLGHVTSDHCAILCEVDILMYK